MNNSTMQTATRLVRQSIVKRCCAFKSSDLKAQLLLGYLLMTFFCDVIIRVSFKVLVPHLYVLEVWQSRLRLCYKE